MLQIGSTVKFDEVRATMKRGDDFRFEFSVNANAAHGCGVPVKGDPLNGDGFAALGHARVSGTDVELFVETLVIATGASNAWRVFVKVDKDSIERVFDDGAFQAFSLQVQASELGNTFTVLQGEVTVEDTASGAVAA